MLVFTVIVGDFSKSDKYAIKKENRERNPSPGNSYCTHAMLDVFDYFPSEHRSFASRFFHGAGDEARTRYLHLGKVALYRMSYTRIWFP